MGFPTEGQLIRCQASQQWSVNFPSALAQPLEFERGETVEWIIEDKSLLVLRRLKPPPPVLRKTLRSSSGSSHSGAAAPARQRPPGAAKSSP